jgi:hypothetical protein
LEQQIRRFVASYSERCNPTTQWVPAA